MSTGIGAVMSAGVPGTGQPGPGTGGSFTILRFTEQYLSDVVHAEQLASALYLEQRPDVEHYLEVMDQLCGGALTPAGTTGFIEQVAKET